MKDDFIDSLIFLAILSLILSVVAVFIYPKGAMDWIIIMWVALIGAKILDKLDKLKP